ncbi:MAG: hypothetical protein U1G07_10685 [Verrucomicrobiota bacterium]
MIWAVVVVMLLAAPAVSGAAELPAARLFNYPADTLAYRNDLLWDYHFDPASGERTQQRRVPRPAYALHCFVVIRMARQFYDHARFEPAEPQADHATYQHLVRRVLARSPRRVSAEENKIVIPGYAHLREFSRDHEALLKSEGGGAWQSFLQRGNWRMIFPFTRWQQDRIAHQLDRMLSAHRPVTVHLVSFPSLALNHGLLLIAARATEGGLEFTAYDPNDQDHLIGLHYDSRRRTFELPPTAYFAGGRVNVYPIYRGALY